MNIYCSGCVREVEARLTDGAEVYPHRSDLHGLPFWKCDGCGNWVGCHHKTVDRTTPLGIIPTPELKRARMDIHAVLDSIWQSGKMTRGHVYRLMAKELGVEEYHTAMIRTVDEARRALEAADWIASEGGCS